MSHSPVTNICSSAYACSQPYDAFAASSCANGSVVGGPSTNESESSRQTYSYAATAGCAHSGPQKKRHMWRYPIPYPRILGGIRSAYAAADAGRSKYWASSHSKVTPPSSPAASRIIAVCDALRKSWKMRTGYRATLLKWRCSSDTERTRSRASRSSAQHT